MPKIVHTLLLWLSISYCSYAFQSNIQDGSNKNFESPTALIDYISQLKEDTENKKLSPEDKLDAHLNIYHGAIQFQIDSLEWKYAYYLSTIYFEENQINEAYRYSNFCYEHPEYIADKTYVAHNKNLMGLLYWEVEDYEKALDMLLESVKSYSAVNPNMVSYPLGNIGEIYYELGDYENALKYNKQTLQFTKKLKAEEFYYNYGFDNVRMSRWYRLLGVQDSAVTYWKESLTTLEHLDSSLSWHKELISYIYFNATELMIEKQDLESAKKYMELAKEHVIDRRKGDMEYLCAEFYLAKNDEATVFNYLSKLDKYEKYELREKVIKLKIKATEKYNRYDQMVEAYKELEAFRKSHLEEKNNKYALFVDVQLENLKKDQQISDLRQEKELAQLTIQKQKAYRLAGWIALIALLLTIGFINYRLRVKNKFTKKLEQEVKSQTIHLQKINEEMGQKNEELERFNFILSHDLKEPIRSIVSFSGLLEKQVKDNPKLKTYSNYIIQSGKQLHSLISDIHSYQDIDKIDFSIGKVDLNILLGQITQEMSSYLQQNNGSIIYDNLPEIEGSSINALEIILKSIIKNGILYNKKPTPIVNITFQTKPSEYQIFIEDNGLGIEPEYHQQVFKLFKRLNNREAFDGSGIGLAVSQKIASRIGAEVEIHSSKQGVGTCFVIRLKRAFHESDKTLSQKMEEGSPALN